MSDSSLIQKKSYRVWYACHREASIMREHCQTGGSCVVGYIILVEVTRRRGRRRKKLLDDLKYRRGYCQLKEEALDRTMWRNRFARGFGPVF